LIGLAGLFASLLAIAPATAATAAPAWSAHICAGTLHKPGTLAGTHWNVIVKGVCLVNRGPAVVQHDLIVTHRAALVAVFGRHHSRLWVGNDVILSRGASLIMGCENKQIHGHPIFPCSDDPSQGHPTLSSHDVVRGDLIAIRALGVVMHNSWIGGNVVQIGGGGGVICKPVGVFTEVHVPVYSDYEDNWIGGGMWVKSLRSCYLGVIRNWIGDSLTVSRNLMADPDAMEVTTNVVLRDLTCYRNRPRVQFGDGHGLPNRVGLHAFYECGFHVILPDPAGQHKHFSHISVHLH
jgi:hypothetical protein